MSESIVVGGIVPAKAEVVYKAWLDSKGHASMTGLPASIDPRVGGRFTAGDGYISGETLKLEPFKRIIQSWRTTDFPADHPDSRLEIRFAENGPITDVTLLHTDLPDDSGESYEKGWLDYYFAPMAEYFRKLK